MSTDLKQRVTQMMAKLNHPVEEQRKKEEAEAFLKLEVLSEVSDPASTMDAVMEHVATLEQQNARMEQQNAGGSNVEILRGSSGLGAAQLAAIRKHEEEKKATQGAELLRASLGLQKAQLDAIRKHASEPDQKTEKNKNRLQAEPLAAHPNFSSRVAATARTVAPSRPMPMPMPSRKAAMTMAKFSKLQEEEEKEEMRLELITYEQQGLGAKLIEKEEQELTLELISEPAPHQDQLSAVREQVAKLEQQRVQIESQNSGSDLELMRGCVGLSSTQMKVIQKYEERKTAQSLEVLRASSGLQRTQLDAIRKHASTQARQGNPMPSSQALSARVVAGKSQSRL